MPADLADALSGIGAKGTAGINDIYSQAKTRRSGEQQMLGMAPGSDSYGAERMPISQKLSQGSLESSLGGVLGNTGYQDALSQRDYEQKRQLAEETASLNKPSLLDQIFQGVGAIGKPLAGYYGMKGKMGGGAGMDYAGGGGSLPPSLSLYPGGGASQYYGGRS